MKNIIVFPSQIHNNFKQIQYNASNFGVSLFIQKLRTQIQRQNSILSMYCYRQSYSEIILFIQI